MVALNLLYDVGSRDESPNRTGLAHLNEHLMFTGSKHAETFDEPMQAAGGEANAWTNVDMTNYYEVLPAHNVELAFWLEADRLQNLTLSPSSVELQKKVVVEEFKQRSLNTPYGDISHLISDLCYKVHPYRWPVLGLVPEHISECTRDEIVEFRQKHYAVNRLVMCVSGNIEWEKALELTDKWFGDIAPVDLPPRNLPQEPMQTEYREMRVHRDVPSNVIYRNYRMCSVRDKEYPIYDLLSDVLANGKSARFYRNVILPSGKFIDLDASVGSTVDKGLFYVKAKLKNGVDPNEAQQLIDDELQKLITEGVSQYELTKYTNKYYANDLLSTMGFADKSAKLCKYELIGKLDEMNSEIDIYRSVTPEQIVETAKQLFVPQKCSTLFYGPDF
ncbi:MAG: insulinase family protein [Muribaculaceae bacterium]|nr:insulinase family protein [Muribaculaceae bacterium]